ncbi:TPA: type II toxin-antitoxin system RelE/ParE family toxin [Staphylococcus aureus]
MEVIYNLIEKELKAIKKSDKVTRHDVFGHINHLSKVGYSITRPQGDQVITDIYELRPKKYRILYTYKNDKAYLLCIYKKSGSKVPTHELNKAIDRKNRL